MSSKEYQAEWHQRNKERRKPLIKARKKEYVQRNLDMVCEFLTERACVDCGNDDIRVLDFDHRPDSDKLDGINNLARRPCSIATLQDEMAKCDIRCANCHRIITCERAGDWRKAIWYQQNGSVAQ